MPKTVIKWDYFEEMPMKEVRSKSNRFEGISVEVIDMYYGQIRTNDVIHCGIKIPNKITRKVFKDSETGKNRKSFNNIRSLLKDLKK